MKLSHPDIIALIQRWNPELSTGSLISADVEVWCGKLLKAHDSVVNLHTTFAPSVYFN